MDPKRLAEQAQARIDAGCLEDAAELYRSILVQVPDDADTHHILGLVYAEQADWGNARATIAAAIRLNPQNALYYRSLGDVCHSSGDVAAALRAYQTARQLHPDDADTLLNLGNAQHAAGALEQALACYQKILSLHPEHVPALNNIGKTYYDQGDVSTAIKFYDKAITLDDTYAEARFNKAVALLLKGDYTSGWAAYEWRFKRKSARHVYPHALQGRRWDGSPFDGERLLVHCEQGLGDVLHFCRYLPMVKALGGTVILEAPAQLAPLLQNMQSVDEVVIFNPAQPPRVSYDRYIPLLSLPLLMKTTLERIPARIPYLQADPIKSSQWRAKIHSGGWRVGLVWSGSNVDPQRACRLADWRSWWSRGQIHFYSLQKGPPLDQLSGLGDDHPIVHIGDRLLDFSDTAAVIANLDMVISVDTAAAHLAGAMGKPVWVLLPFMPDWRWLLDRPDSPWYPTARLFRQNRRNDWSRVIAEVGAALKKQTKAAQAPAVCGADVADPASGLNIAALKHFEKGVQQAQAGEFNPAVKSFQQTITLQPQYAEAHFELGAAYHAQGLFDQAIDAYRSASRLAPAMQPVYANLGLAHYQKGDLDQAAHAYELGIRLHRDLARLFTNLGVVREAQNHIEEAIECYQCALRIDPAHADALYNLGNIHLARRHLESARSCYSRTLQIDPRHAKALGNLGRTCHLMGFLDEALKCYDQALALRPGYPEVHLNRAVSRLLVGQWQEGWADYEWRFQCHDRQRIYPHQLYGERWQGAPFEGKTLLVHSEQGIGDAIQYARYLPLVKQRGGRVVFEVRHSLMNLFASLAGVDELIELSADKPPAVHYQIHVPLGSLPGIFKTMPGNVPYEGPYLKADPVKTAHWKRRLPEAGLNVGLVWGGNDTYKERSCNLVDMAPLAFVKGINWIGLQKGPAAVQCRPEHLPYNFKVDNWGEAFEDFSDTAAVVTGLDLIISIDTAVAHLSGAMGKPVWVLLPAVPDWRWLLERSQNPWYPTAHLFRQSKDGNWGGVIAKVCGSLERWRKNR
ncbi:MAG: tetratricopeptide repeat protein [Desulfobacteraceae bacterium]|nr:MAG: tetratricopeptide repeat protein [Desulfobacteraceae bacterium]